MLFDIELDVLPKLCEKVLVKLLYVLHISVVESTLKRSFFKVPRGGLNTSLKVTFRSSHMD